MKAEDIYKAMDEHAKVRSIEFAKWIHEFECSYSEGNWEIYTPKEYQGKYTTEQLYSMFIESLK